VNSGFFEIHCWKSLLETISQANLYFISYCLSNPRARICFLSCVNLGPSTVLDLSNWNPTPWPDGDSIVAPTLWDSSFWLFLQWQLQRLIHAIWSSPQWCQAWLWDAALHQQSKVDDMKRPLMLILDVHTHWSSTHQMLHELALSIISQLFHAQSQVMLLIIMKSSTSF
jgi:hypothetical protein